MMPLKETLKLMKKSLLVSVKVKGSASLAVSIIGFAMALVPVVIAKILEKFTNQITGLVQNATLLSDILLTLFFLVLLYLLQAAYKNIHAYYAKEDQMSTEKYIKQTLLDLSSRVEYKYIENEGDFQKKLVFAEKFGGSRVAASMQQLIYVLQSAITLFSTGFVLLQVNPVIVLIVFAASLPALILAFLQKEEEYKNNAKNMDEGAMSVHLYYIGSGANERCKSLLDLRFNRIYQWVKEKWRKVSLNYVQKKRAMTQKHVLYNAISDLLRNGIYIGVLAITAYQIYQNPVLGLGIFTLVYATSAQLQKAITDVFISGARFFSDLFYIKDFFDLQSTPVENLENKEEGLKNADIDLANVSFAYPGSDRMALKNINVNIRRGEKIAILGHNGSGKSTFVNLLCGLYEPSQGEIHIGGAIPHKNLGLVRDHLCATFQNFGKYETTIRDNITVSAIDKKSQDEDLYACLQKVDLDQVVKAYPKGLDEEIGSYSESGNDLSGGQWQKLALARALYKDKASIMILDEPTSALDPVAETQIYKNFSNITKDKTTILISHRLGIASIADRILLFDEGEIVADGNHETLIQTSPLYQQLYYAQAKWYL